MFDTLIDEFNTAYSDAIDTIVKLRETAEEIKNKMDDIIDSCETIEGEL